MRQAIYRTEKVLLTGNLSKPYVAMQYPNLYISLNKSTCICTSDVQGVSTSRQQEDTTAYGS